MKKIKSLFAIVMAVLMLILPQAACYADEWTPNIICDKFSVSDNDIQQGDSFKLTFSLKNTSGDFDVNNMLIRISGGDAFDIANSTDTIYKDCLKKSSSAEFSKQLYCNDSASAGMHPVNISVSYEYMLNGEKISESREFSVSIKVNNQVTQSKVQALTPQLIITDFSYGGSEVNASSQFNLDFKLKNNSNSIAVQNVIIKLSGGDFFVVADGTDTVCVNRIDAASSSNVSKSFKCLNSTPSGIYPVSALVSYEYFDGDERAQATAELTMSIPVVQIDKFSFEGISLSDQTIIVDQETDCAFKIINSGQTKLSNCTVSVTDEKGKVLASAFIGSIEAGTQFESNYTLPIKFSEIGNKKLTLKLDYENENLEQKSAMQEFNLTVEEYNDPFADIDVSDDIENTSSSSKLPFIIAAVAVIVVVAVIVSAVLVKKRKSKKGSEAFNEEI